MKIKINKDFAQYKQGDILTVESDSENTPKDIYWRNRLKDAKIDNCCEVVMKRPTKPKKGDE